VTKHLPESQSFRQGSIRRQLVVFVAALVIFTALALTLGGYLVVQQFLLAGVRDWLTLDAANRVEMLRAYIQQQQERVALVASRTQLRHFLQQYLEGTLSPAPFQEQSRLLSVVSRA
jgi:hypothetical protein